MIRQILHGERLMTERMKTFIYCAITAIVTTIVVSAGQPRAVQATELEGRIPQSYTINHVISFASVGVGGRGSQHLTLTINKQ